MDILSVKSTFITAYLKGEEARLVTQAHIDKLLRARDVPEVVEIIKDTDIGTYLDSVLLTNFDEVDRALWFYLDDCLKRIEQYGQNPDIMQKLLDAYIVKYDILNVKAALEGVSSGKKARFFPLGIINQLGCLGELGNVQDVAGIEIILVKCGLAAYAEIVRSYQKDGAVKARLGVEASLDRQYYADLYAVAGKASDHVEILKALGTVADIRNLKILLRSVARGRVEEISYANVGGGYAISSDKIKELAALTLEQFPAAVPYEYVKLATEAVQSFGRNKDIVALGEIADRYEYSKLHDILSLKLMSPMMIVWYLVLKETEIRNLRLIIRALFDNVSLEQIRDYLVVSL